MANPHLNPVLEAVKCLEDAWGDATNASDLTRAELLEAHRALGLVQRRLDGVHAEIAAKTGVG